MKKRLDEDIQAVKEGLIRLIVPEGMTVKDRNELARKAGITSETFRKMIARKSVQADSLIRLLLASGVKVESLVNLPKDNTKAMSKGSKLWLDLGNELSEDEKVEFSSLIRYIKAKWKID